MEVIQGSLLQAFSAWPHARLITHPACLVAVPLLGLTTASSGTSHFHPRYLLRYHIHSCQHSSCYRNLLYFYYRNDLLGRNSISKLKHTIGPPSWAHKCPTAPRHNLTDQATLLALLLISTESALGAATTTTHANLSLDQGKLMFLLQKPSGSHHQHTRMPYKLPGMNRLFYNSSCASSHLH